MSPVCASAPGKLFLLGEYAVLEGYSALLTAVRQRANVQIRYADVNNTPTQAGVLMKTGPDPMLVSLEKTPLLESALECFTAQGLWHPGMERDRQFLLDTEAFYRQGNKLGLGSSAALTVALVMAMLGDREVSDRCTLTREEALDLCLGVHRHFQGGIGSGADVVTSWHGGQIEWKQGEFPTGLKLPDTIKWLFVWTGVPAGTMDYVKGLFEWRDGHKTAYNQHLEHLGQISEAGCIACRDNDGNQLLNLLEEYNACLKRLSDVSGTRFYSDVHQEISAKASEAGLVYKPSGAGGGDFGLIAGIDESKINDLAGNLGKNGYLTQLTEFSDRGFELQG